MKLSILIPTHNRPVLFDRCLKSALRLLDGSVEIIVNNDSNDIRPLDHPNVSYHYNQFDNLSAVYQFLLKQAKGEFVYFLEDDDHLTNSFADVSLEGDLIAGNYFPTYDTAQAMHDMKMFANGVLGRDDFINVLNVERLQLGQFIFKQSTIKDFAFPTDNNIYNDLNLVMYAATKCKDIHTTGKVLFFQTIDGGDNISFKETTTQLNITKSYEFLKDYEIQPTMSRTAGS